MFPRSLCSNRIMYTHYVAFPDFREHGWLGDNPSLLGRSFFRCELLVLGWIILAVCALLLDAWSRPSWPPLRSPILPLQNWSQVGSGWSCGRVGCKNRGSVTNSELVSHASQSFTTTKAACQNCIVTFQRLTCKIWKQQTHVAYGYTIAFIAQIVHTPITISEPHQPSTVLHPCLRLFTRFRACRAQYTIISRAAWGTSVAACSIEA